MGGAVNQVGGGTITSPVVADGAAAQTDFAGGIESVMHPYLWTGTSWQRGTSVQGIADGGNGAGTQSSGLSGFNGTTWDRLVAFGDADGVTPQSRGALYINALARIFAQGGTNRVRQGAFTGALLQSIVPWNAIPQEVSNNVAANTALTVSIPAGGAGVTSFITGFHWTAALVTTTATVSITVTGLTNTLTYVVSTQTGAPSMLPVTFPFPLQASATNTAITVNVPALNVGSGISACTAYGFTVNLANL